MIRSILIVGAGGFLGTVLRYLAGVATNRWLSSAWPWSTFTVNILGCFIMGAVMASTERWGTWRLFFATGFCGGFTTFSAFAQENFQYLQEGNHLHFLLYTGASVILGILATTAGLLLFRGI